MTVIIKKTDTREQIDKKLLRLTASPKGKRKAGFNAAKYAGKGIFAKVDGLDYQKKVRNEWGK